MTKQEPSGSNSDLWRDLHECASRLEQSLSGGGEAGDLRRFLPPTSEPRRRAILHELIKTYLEHLFRQHRGCLLEEFLRCYPELGGPEDLPADLLYEEYRIRWIFGDRPGIDEYHSRFPAQFEQFCRVVRRESPNPPAARPPATVRERDTLSPLPDLAEVMPSAKPTVTSVPVAAATGLSPSGMTLMLSGGEGYHLLDRIGKGEFGEVYRALAPGGVVVAVKRVLRPVSDEFSQRELRALKRVSEIRHPFLLQTHNFQAFGDHLVIVMELADGSLVDRFKECREAGLPGIPADELLRYFTEAAEALDFLHREKLSHRDIKPANLLHVKGHAKVADFGIARRQEASVDQTLNFAGTPAYMAPEVWGREVSVHSDQYSFAATWFEMRTGRRVFTGLSLPEVAFQHMSGPRDLTGVPVPEQEVLRRALAKVPDERFPSCMDFVRALKQAIEPPAPKPKPPGRRTGIALASLAGAALALGALVVSMSMRQPQPLSTISETPKAAVDWLPAGWEPASPDEPIETDRTGRHYRQLARDFGGERVVMVLVPQAEPSDPPTFYLMQNKVWNALYRVFLQDPKSQALFSKYRNRPGCEVLLKPGEWEKGAWAYRGGKRMDDLGVGDGRARMPVFRTTATEAECFAEWMGGRLPKREQYIKAALEGVPVPPVFDGDPEGLALNLRATGPWTVDQGDRDVIGFGCRQLVTNGREFTRSIQDGPPDELPLEDLRATLDLYVVGKSYLSKEAPSVANLRGVDHIAVTDASPEVSFRVVLQEK